MRRVRVLRIITRLNVGGPAFQAILLSRALEERGIETLLVAGLPGEDQGDLSAAALREGVRLERLPALGRRISAVADLAAFIGLVRIVRRFRPHVVHTHMAKAGLIGRLAAAAAGPAGHVRVHTFHGHVFRGYFRPWISRGVVRIERALSRLTHRIVAVGPTVRDEICERYAIAPPEKVVTIPLGVPRMPKRRKGPWSPRLRRPPTLGFAGRLVPIKDPVLFIETAARVRAALPGLRVEVAGDGPLRGDVQRAARDAGIDDALALHGWRDDMRAFYEEIDLLLLSSRNEGTPRSILEAQAAGLPVVAVDVGGVRDLFTPDRLAGDITVCKEGIIVSRRDPEALAGACLRVLGDPAAAASMGDAGRRRAIDRNGEDRLVDETEALYRDLLAGSMEEGGRRWESSAAPR